MPVTSTSHYAALAQNAYQAPIKNDSINVEGSIYNITGIYNNPLTGYQGTAYQSEDRSKIIIAHRGTDVSHNPIQDLMTDTKMVIAGFNLQALDAKNFTKKIIQMSHGMKTLSGQPVSISVTGHSLGGALAQMTSHDFGLPGETFNAYGAAEMLPGMPEGQGEIINNVRATDVVSAASPHYGQVRIYATEGDIAKLNGSNYHNDSRFISLRNPFGGIDLDAHSIDNFARGKDSEATGASAQNANRYYRNKHAVDLHRHDVKTIRIPLSVLWLAPKKFIDGAKDVGALKLKLFKLISGHFAGKAEYLKEKIHGTFGNLFQFIAGKASDK